MEISRIRPNNLPLYTRRILLLAVVFIALAIASGYRDQSGVADPAVAATPHGPATAAPTPTSVEAPEPIESGPSELSELPAPSPAVLADEVSVNHSTLPNSALAGDDVLPSAETQHSDTTDSERSEGAVNQIREATQAEPARVQSAITTPPVPTKPIENTDLQITATQAANESPAAIATPTNASATKVEVEPSVAQTISATKEATATEEPAEEPTEEPTEEPAGEQSITAVKNVAAAKEPAGEQTITAVKNVTAAKEPAGEQSITAVKDVSATEVPTGEQSITAVKDVSATEESAVGQNVNASSNPPSEVSPSNQPATTAKNALNPALTPVQVAPGRIEFQQHQLTAPTQQPAETSNPEPVAEVAEVEPVSDVQPQAIANPATNSINGSAQASPAKSTPPAPVAGLAGRFPGKLLMLVFWSSEAENIIDNFSWLNNMHDQYAGRGLQILAVNQDAQPRDGEVFAVKNGARFSVIYDRDRTLQRALWVSELPATYILNDKGALLGSHLGFLDDIRGNYEDELRRLLQSNR